jgi:hypothetical protein
VQLRSVSRLDLVKVWRLDCYLQDMCFGGHIERRRRPQAHRPEAAFTSLLSSALVRVVGGCVIGLAVIGVAEGGRKRAALSRGRRPELSPQHQPSWHWELRHRSPPSIELQTFANSFPDHPNPSSLASDLGLGASSKAVCRLSVPCRPRSVSAGSLAAIPLPAQPPCSAPLLRRRNACCGLLLV